MLSFHSLVVVFCFCKYLLIMCLYYLIKNPNHLVEAFQKYRSSKIVQNRRIVRDVVCFDDETWLTLMMYSNPCKSYSKIFSRHYQIEKFLHIHSFYFMYSSNRKNFIAEAAHHPGICLEFTVETSRFWDISLNNCVCACRWCIPPFIFKAKIQLL